MSAAVITLTALLSLVFVAAGAQKLLLRRAVIVNLRRLGVGTGPARTLGVLELLGVLGLVIGLWYPLAGVAAASGIVLLMAGAITYHAMAGDYGRRNRQADAFVPPVLLIMAGALGALLLNV